MQEHGGYAAVDAPVFLFAERVLNAGLSLDGASGVRSPLSVAGVRRAALFEASAVLRVHQGRHDA